MTDTEHNRRWLTDDPFIFNALLLVAASSLAIALTSCLWHHIYHNDNAPSFLSFNISTPLASSQNQSTSLAQEQKDRKSTRSKERRRRGKNPFRDLFKGGKKSKALLRAIKAVDHDTPPSADTLSNPSVHSTSSTSRSQSPEPAEPDTDHSASRPGVESDDGSSVKDSTPNSDASAVEDLSDHSASGVRSHADRIRSHSCSPDLVTTTDTQVNVSSASTVIGQASELAPSSPPVSAPYVPQSCDLQTMSTSPAGKPGRARTRIRMSEIDPSIQSSPSTVDSVEITFPSIYSVPCPSLSKAASTNFSADGAGPSTPTNSRESTPPPRTPLDPSYEAGVAQHLHPGVAAAQAQLASMRDALEAARLREEHLRVEAEQASKERDQLCWRWNEDAGVWRRREAELQAQIHHLMQQVQAYAAVASFPSSGFSSPTSPRAHASPALPHPVLAPFPLPPVIQTQNSASPPAHVQALLACAPMLTSHAPGPVTAVYPGVGHGMSPWLWSGMGLFPNRDVRGRPDSSPGRRRQRVKSASDESLLDGVDGPDKDPWEEEEEAEFRNEALADAILKRPESIRDLSVRKRSVRGTNSLTHPVVDAPVAPVAP